MISKDKPVVDYVEVFFADKTQEPLALVYVVRGVGEYIRKDGGWERFTADDPELFDGTEYITLEKKDALELKLLEKFDNNEEISRDEVFAKGTDKYDDI
jgi:hypothetical protein